MISPSVAPAVGKQQPRVSHYPEYASSTGAEAVELAAMAGLHLDPWEAFVLEHSLGERPDGKWSAFEVGLTVSRQNGKGAILEARELAGLFLLEERMLIHSAHQFDTSLEAFRRLETLIDGTADFSRRVKRISRSHGEEGIELLTGQRIRFRTRTKGGGRGFSCDCLIYDEDMILPEAVHSATLFTLSARPNPQVWYTGSAVDQEVHEHGIVKTRVRERGLKGNDPSLAYFEWSADVDHPESVEDDVASDPEVWAQANPALGIRISQEHIEREQRSMDNRGFAVERLGVGDWPDPEGLVSSLIPNWPELEDAESTIKGDFAFAFDVSPDRGSAAISTAGRRADALYHVEVIEHRRGTGWLVGRLHELAQRYRVDVVCDEKGPAASFIKSLQARGVKVHTVNGAEYARDCGRFYDACGVEDDDVPALRHLGTSELTAAVRGARQRPLGDAWAWSRKSSTVDITPLVSCTLALGHTMQFEPSKAVHFL